MVQALSNIFSVLSGEREGRIGDVDPEADGQDREGGPLPGQQKIQPGFLNDSFTFD